MISFLKRETVFCIALLAALVSALFNPPSAEWAGYPDYRTLALLFCLMGVSEGLKASGMFAYVGDRLEKGSGNVRRLSFLLVAIVFVSSMFFTNDVALLMFVPFTLLIMDREKMDEGYIVRLVVIETIAANLGSMTTPVGNPQNIYICSFFDMDAGSFFSTILPYSAASAVLVAVCCILFLSQKRTLDKDGHEEDTPVDRRRTGVYLTFLLLALMAVFKVLDWRILFFAELAYLVIFDRRILASIDYILLLTFVCFFVFSGNMKSIPAVSAVLTGPMQAHPIAASALVSQVISNVPAAILLSPFASGPEGVLVGTDIGGLGTPVASLASLISLKFYFSRKGGAKGRYLMVFTLLNFALLAVLAALSLAL